MGTLAPITTSTQNDRYITRQGGIDYVQTRDVVAENFRNSRWNNTVDYLQYSETKGINGVTYIAKQASGPNNGGAVDPVTDTDESHWEEKFTMDVNQLEVLPRNSDWNVFFDPSHQVQLPSPAGYPSDSGSGGTVYGLDDEWSLDCFSGSVGNTISSDADGVIFTGSIYKKYEYTAEQIALIDETEVPVFIKSQDGTKFNFKNGDIGVTVSKSGTTLTVTLDAAIFGVTGINKVWRFFVTEEEGNVVELGTSELASKLYDKIMPLRQWRDVTASRLPNVLYTNTSSFPMEVYILIITTFPGTRTLEINGFPFTQVIDSVVNSYMLHEKTVYPGETYRYTGFFTTWSERAI
jgi:hypothetical protein